MPRKNSVTSRRRQTRLTFSPAPSSAVPAGSPGTDLRSPAFVRFTRPGQKIESFFHAKPTESGNRQIATVAARAESPTPISRQRRTTAVSSRIESDPSDVDVIDDVPLSTSKNKRKRAVVDNTQIDSYLKTRSPSSSPRQKKKRRRRIEIHSADITHESGSSDSDSDDDDGILFRAKRKGVSSQGIFNTQRNLFNRHVGDGAKEIRSLDPSNRSDDTRQASSNESEDNGSDGSDDVIASSSRLRRRIRQQQHITSEAEVGVSDDNDDDVKPHTPGLKRVRRTVNPEEADNHYDQGDEKDQNEIDLGNDLRDLEDSAVKDTRTRGRIVDSARAKRRIHLEALRQRRAGVKQPEAQENESEKQDEQNESSGGDDPSPPIVQVNDDDEDNDNPFNSDIDKDDKDFIVDDDNDEYGQLGAPADEALSMLPFEFSRHRYKHSKQYFKDVVEWMVHNKLNPAFPRNDEMYKAAFQKISDEVMGLAASQLISSVWTLPFRRALEARPRVEVTVVDAEYDSCDACKRSKHPARYEVVFRGKPYSLETLEPLKDVDDDNSDDEGEEGARSKDEGITEDGSEDEDEKRAKRSEETSEQNINRQGNTIPPDGTIFRLGKHCKAKAEMAHSLLHWRYELNEWVVDWLTDQDILTKKQIRRRRKWSTIRQTRYANSVVDMMVEFKEVDKLWKDFKKTVRYARDTKEPVYPYRKK